jgi:TetR/AcrR family transcriptional repressor of mexJK operon
MSETLAAPPRNKRAEITRAASDLFAFHGYGGTSMDMIAEAANVSRQTIYNQFESKEALFRALVDGLIAELVSPLEHLPPRKTLRETLDAFAEHALTLVLRPKTLALQRLIAEIGRSPDFARVAYEAGPHRAHETLAKFLREQARSGHLVIADPFVAAVHFFALVTRDSEVKALFGFETGLSAAERRRRAREGVDVFLRAYGKPACGHAPATERRRRASARRA